MHKSLGFNSGDLHFCIIRLCEGMCFWYLNTDSDLVVGGINMEENKSRTIVIPSVTHSSGAGQKPKLLVTSGPLEGREYVILKFPYTIGSGCRFYGIASPL